jgi:hypothetical protein
LIGDLARESHGRVQTVRQMTPCRLSFFDFIVLANTVHEHAPMYSLFRRQCYWFANSIFTSFLWLMVPPTPPHPSLLSSMTPTRRTKFPKSTFFPNNICRT